MGYGIIIWIFLITVLIFWFIIDRNYRLYFLRIRRDHKNLWRKAFNEEEFEKVHKLLEIVCHAFLLPKKYCFRFRPSDDIHKIYKRNQKYAAVDSMEYEILIQALENNFGLNCEQLISEQPCTIDDLIRKISTPLKIMESEQLH